MYGEFDLIDLLKLKIDIVNGNITEKLCTIDKNDRAYTINEYAFDEGINEDSLEFYYNKLLKELLNSQMDKFYHETKT